MNDELETGAVGVEHGLLERGRFLDEQTAGRRVVRIRLEERRRPRTHRPVGEELDAADADPVVAEAGRHTRLPRAFDAVILDGIDPGREPPGCEQRLIRAQLGRARRHVLDGRHAERGRVLQRRPDPLADVVIRRRRDRARDELHRVVFEDARGLARAVAHDGAALGGLRGLCDTGQRHRQRVGDRHVAVEPLHEDGMVRNGAIDELTCRQRFRRP